MAKLPPLPQFKSPANIEATKKAPEITFQSGSEGADVYFQATGLGALEENLKSLGRVAMDAAGYEMAAIMREIIIDSQENYVPVDSGDLHDTADSDEYQPNRGETITKIAAWYAAPGQGAERVAAPTRASRARLAELHEIGGSIHDPAKYALDQHENPTYVHGLNWSGSGLGQPEYLKRPFDAKVPSMLERIGKAVGIGIGAK